MTNTIGVISALYARPFTRANFDAFARARAAGCDFVELLVPEPGELDLAETRSALADNGLGAALAARVNPQRDLASADPGCHDAGVRYLQQCVQVAAELGAAIVGGPLYGAPLVFAGRAPAPVAESERLRRLDRVVSGLRTAGETARAAGVTLAIEPLNRFETDIANTTEHGLQLVEAVGSPAVGLMLDTFHMNMEDWSLPEAIRRAGPHLVHFQACENNRGYVGSGHIDWPAVARALVAASYRGAITLEPFRRNDERVGVPLAQWRPPDGSEDAQLARSVAFLRATLDFAWGQA